MSGLRIVMPAQAGIQDSLSRAGALDSSLRWNDGGSGVMPAQAGIQKAKQGLPIKRCKAGALDSSLRWNDGRVR